MHSGPILGKKLPMVMVSSNRKAGSRCSRPESSTPGRLPCRTFTMLAWTYDPLVSEGSHRTSYKSGRVRATRLALQEWVAGLPHPWVAAMKATLFTGWVYDFLSPFNRELKVAHPEMLKAITAARKRTTRRMPN